MATQATTITVEANINAPVAKVWKLWNGPEHIVKWGSPSPDWHTTSARHDLKPGGTFNFRMEAKDGSMGFDFGGVYDVVRENECIEYTMGDGRKVKLTFTGNGNNTHIVENFEAENENPIEQQRTGWQAIIDNFKQYAESQS